MTNVMTRKTPEHKRDHVEFIAYRRQFVIHIRGKQMHKAHHECKSHYGILPPWKFCTIMVSTTITTARIGPNHATILIQ